MLQGYVPAGISLAEAEALRDTRSEDYVRRSTASAVRHVQAMLDLQQRGAVTFDYGNNLRTVAHDAGLANAFDFPGFVPAYVRPLFCEGKGPFRWVALSGDPADIHRTDDLVLELFPEDEHLRRWITLAREKIHFQGLPARICWLGQGDAREVRRRAQRPGRVAANCRRPSPSGATTSTPGASRRRSARPRR